MPLCSIGELAVLLGVAVITLRRWHQAGKLVPACRTAGGHRRYDVEAAQMTLGLTCQDKEAKPTLPGYMARVVERT